jgi:hypothetical protein
MVSNQELLANKDPDRDEPLSTSICSQTTEESKGTRNVHYSPTEATGETVAKIYYSPAEREMGLKVDSNEKMRWVGKLAIDGHQCGDRGLFAF